MLSAYDGDSIRVDLDCDIDFFCKNQPIRLRGFDTAEIRGKCDYEKRLAIKGRNFTKQFLGTKIHLQKCKREKYGRLLCFAYNDKGESVKTAILKTGFARKYGGEKRKSWCE